MRSFLLMLAFFTRLPVPHIPYTDERYIRGIPLLPLVGAVTGAFLYCASLIRPYLPLPLSGVLLFLLYLLLTGGLHLDGLADSCDALYSGRDRETMLEIMKDSRSGSFGVLGLITAAAFYLALLPDASPAALFFFPVIGKCTPSMAVNLSPYIRPGGMARLFSEHCSRTCAVLHAGLVLLAAGLADATLLLPAVLSLLFAVALVRRIRRILGGITGDILGLLCETTQIVFLVLIPVVGAAAERF
ncbi:MAG: adenosylcobinamide-GDP ribazoletransferase [Bacillota bacterium]|jgi:adenosylcobinamide-GDP ribazoletransferase|nr:adenosylcobinamide-GDP ribazoletransferase [Eubacteriales bacterium]MDI9491293.1 adenosylcobinamide-GDP ribazoletransferase [Bacillota bacterium]NLV70230.1 adenosylcobinamide-GDP ribazoletransferase [Clostridiales bacterium]HPF18591.1 adenosylcobinamide-GDP ribazoletransferase [Bacillota bacterium]